MSYGPNPWQQTNWDARAAGNFMGGGAGCGLLLFATAAGAQGTLRVVLVVVALALIGVGLLCVWAEIGRPWRALNVFFHPQTSWMSREAAVAPLLMASGAASLLWPQLQPLAAVLAAVFLYCQARILQACKGIPAWREPMTVPLVAATGLAEGAGLYWILAPWWGQGNILSWLTLGALLLLRFVLGSAWRRRLAAALRPASLRAVDRTALGWKAGSLLPLALVLIGAAAPPLPSVAALLLQLLAGLLALGGGALFKFMLVTKAGFNQGFALPHLPVRGVRRG
ncbi:MAG TPA: dimethyl sulfoxide reductase anchor subunit [Rubrivivax sp.]|nr:dimethyl sulfoxide reductase anchor subunit [Rubrivivax sp.]HRY86767.1 dimethyl sulfoxide reductase anchor subunit [Rubrivivax sp.]HRZ58969.1 dimethyl sulfoxide reductase anchor subunit [Rubrivivax sp.]